MSDKEYASVKVVMPPEGGPPYLASVTVDGKTLPVYGFKVVLTGDRDNPYYLELHVAPPYYTVETLGLGTK